MFSSTEAAADAAAPGIAPVLPHDRGGRFQPNADRTALIDKGALGGNSFGDILGSQYRRHPATNSKRAPTHRRKLWFKRL